MNSSISKLVLALGLVFPFICNADNFVRGINYDPIHSVVFSHGLGTDNKELLEKGIFDDLDKLRDLEDKSGFKITHLKTFFTVYSSLHNTASINMADTVYQWNQMNPHSALTLALGVYQFRRKTDACMTEEECVKWTQAQIEGVKQALLNYNQNSTPLIDRIIVGNENLESFGDIDTRLVKDINEIKQFIQDNNIQHVSVGTAQTDGTVRRMYEGYYQDV